MLQWFAPEAFLEVKLLKPPTTLPTTIPEINSAISGSSKERSSPRNSQTSFPATPTRPYLPGLPPMETGPYTSWRFLMEEKKRRSSSHSAPTRKSASLRLLAAWAIVPQFFRNKVHRGVGSLKHQRHSETHNRTV